jgi:hypothetical protein
MPRLAPTDWRILVKIFKADGFKEERANSSHIVLTRAGCLRPIIIPKYKEVGIDIIKNNMRVAEMDRERYFQLLKSL